MIGHSCEERRTRAIQPTHGGRRTCSTSAHRSPSAGTNGHSNLARSASLKVVWADWWACLKMRCTSCVATQTQPQSCAVWHPVPPRRPGCCWPLVGRTRRRKAGCGTGPSEHERSAIGSAPRSLQRNRRTGCDAQHAAIGLAADLLLASLLSCSLCLSLLPASCLPPAWPLSLCLRSCASCLCLPACPPVPCPPVPGLEAERRTSGLELDDDGLEGAAAVALGQPRHVLEQEAAGPDLLEGVRVSALGQQRCGESASVQRSVCRGAGLCGGSM